MSNKEYIRFSFLGMQLELRSPSLKTIIILIIILSFFFKILTT
jgi:hypothetical protein